MNTPLLSEHIEEFVFRLNKKIHVYNRTYPCLGDLLIYLSTQISGTFML